MGAKKIWTAQQLLTIKTFLPKISVKELARKIKTSPDLLRLKIKDLGLYHIVEAKMLANRFKKGECPNPNKGKPITAWMSKERIEGFEKTQYKKGHKPANQKEDFEESVKNIADKQYHTIRCPIKQKMVFKHVWLWEQKYGKVPEGYVLRFKDGNQNHCVIENIELVLKEEMTLRNFNNHNYPQELIPTYSKIAKVKNKIKNLEHGKN